LQKSLIADQHERRKCANERVQSCIPRPADAGAQDDGQDCDEEERANDGWSDKSDCAAGVQTAMRGRYDRFSHKRKPDNGSPQQQHRGCRSPGISAAIQSARPSQRGMQPLRERIQRHKAVGAFESLTSKAAISEFARAE
jgi:hypothetical protein